METYQFQVILDRLDILVNQNARLIELLEEKKQPTKKIKKRISEDDETIIR